MSEEKISAVVSLKEYNDEEYLFMATKSGIVKKTHISEYENIRKTGLQAINLREDDELIEVKVTNNEKDIILVTKHGMCIRFKETDVRPTGRTSIGVRGMNLGFEDEVVGMQMDTQGPNILLVSEFGMGKRTAVEDFSVQHRGGKGVKTINVTERNGQIVAIRAVEGNEDLLIITDDGIVIRLPMEQVNTAGRATQGVRLIKVHDSKVSSVEVVAKNEEEVVEEGEDEPGKHDAEVLHRDGKDLRRHLHPPQQGRRQQDTEGRKDQREHGARDGGGGDLTLHPRGVARAVGCADAAARAAAKPVDEEDGLRHQRIGCANGGEGVLAHEFAHDDAVGGVVGELEQVAQHQRNGKFDQQRRNSTAGHVLGHEKRPSFLLIEAAAYTMLARPLKIASAARLLQLASSWAAACRAAPALTEAGMASVRSTCWAARWASRLATAETLSTT